jgi:hypothetical protein
MNPTLQTIMEAKDAGRKKVHMEAWGVDLVIIEPTREKILRLKEEYGAPSVPPGATEAEIVEQLQRGLDAESAEKFGMACIVEMVHDVEGNRVFENIEQVKEVLNKKAVRSTNKLMEECMSLVNGPTAEQVKEAEGNLEEIQS